VVRGVEAADVVELTSRLVDSVRSAPERGWDARAGALEWDVQHTLEHVAASLAKYTLYLASGASRYVPMAMRGMAGEATREDWLHALTACATAFASTARATPVRSPLASLSGALMIWLKPERWADRRRYTDCR